MATIVVFHSALGLRPAVRRFAERLRASAHEVHTPDLFDGRVFDDLVAGESERDAIGVPALVERAVAAVAELPAELVYAGFSMGVAPAQLLAATRAGARGALLMHGALSLETIGVEAWPTHVPVQLHLTEDDPWVDQEEVSALIAALPADVLDRHVYPGCAHLFTDADGPDHDGPMTERLLGRATRWLAALDGRGHGATA